MRDFLKQLFRNFLQIFSGWNLLGHFLAIAFTSVIVMSGFDWLFFTWVASSAERVYFFPALMLGSFLPILVPLVFFVIWFFTKNRAMLILGAAEAQAAILGSAVSSFYKSLTGRIQPPGHFQSAPLDVSQLIDSSHNFQFGFLRHGIFWGWPSSHTTLAFAMAVTIWFLFPKNKVVRTIALGYAGYVGLGVAVTSIHWFSEAVAGVLIGSVIGIVVGKSYAERVSGHIS